MAAELLPVEDALARILARVRRLPAETVDLAGAAGRVLAREAIATVDLPSFPSSAMDGFALGADDTPGTLPVVAESAAGDPSARAVEAGEAIAISTGGVVPAGADAVVPVEHVRRENGAIVVEAAVEPGENVRPRGGDIAAGSVVVEQGVTLTPPRLAALASAGIARLECARSPQVAIVTTGSELRPPGTELAAGQIYESNSIMLSALLSSAGAVVRPAESAADDEAAHREALARGLTADVLVTSGGVSVGEHDLVRGTLAGLGAEEVLWGVAMRPGKPFAFAVRGETLVFGLPGNPVSSFVGAVLFVVPAIRALQGVARPEPPFRAGVLGEAVRRRRERDDFQRARAEVRDGEVVLRPLAGQESHMIARTALADALVHVPRGEGQLDAGAPVRYLPLDPSGSL